MKFHSTMKDVIVRMAEFLRIILHASANLFLAWTSRVRNWRVLINYIMKHINKLYFIEIKSFLARTLHKVGHIFSHPCTWVIGNTAVVSSWMPTWTHIGFQENYVKNCSEIKFKPILNVSHGSSMKKWWLTISHLTSYCKSTLYCKYGPPCHVKGEGNGTPLQYCCPENSLDGGAWWAAVHGVAKSQTRLSDFTFTFHFHALEKEMATHSSFLAWRIPWME